MLADGPALSPFPKISRTLSMQNNCVRWKRSGAFVMTELTAWPYFFHAKAQYPTASVSAIVRDGATTTTTTPMRQQGPISLPLL